MPVSAPHLKLRTLKLKWKLVNDRINNRPAAVYFQIPTELLEQRRILGELIALHETPITILATHPLETTTHA